MSMSLPDRALSTRGVEDPRPDGYDETARLELGDEVVRLDDAALRMLPPKQRLDPGQCIRLEIDRRLVHEEELVRLLGSAEVRCKGSVVLGGLLHLLCERDRAVLPSGLCGVQGGVGVPQQLLG